MKNYYKTLGIDPLSSQEDIKKAYRELAKKYHPDVSDLENTEDLIREINEAYEVLSNEDERRKYDLHLKYTIDQSSKTAQSRVSGDHQKKTRFTKNSYRTVIQSNHTIGHLIIAFLIVLLIGGIVFFVEWSYIDEVKNKHKQIEIGMTANDVIKHYGDPNEMSASELRYGQCIILIENNEVIGWYDAECFLDIKNEKIESVSDILIGEHIDGIIRDYGYPDTYAKQFLIYDLVVIYYDDEGFVTMIENIAE